MVISHPLPHTWFKPRTKFPEVRILVLDEKYTIIKSWYHSYDIHQQRAGVIHRSCSTQHVSVVDRDHFRRYAPKFGSLLQEHWGQPIMQMLDSVVSQTIIHLTLKPGTIISPRNQLWMIESWPIGSWSPPLYLDLSTQQRGRWNGMHSPEFASSYKNCRE